MQLPGAGPGQSPTISRALLIPGLLAPGLFFLADFVSSLRYRRYDARHQAVSELSARGAPTHLYMSFVLALLSLSLLATAAGVALSGAGAAAKRIGALLGVAASLAMVLLVIPIHPRSERASLVDLAHGTVTGGAVMSSLAAMFLGRGLHGRRWRRYSWGTIASIVAVGLPTTVHTFRLFARRSTPWMGLFQRIGIYAYVIWVGALAAVTLRNTDRSGVGLGEE